ncbi:MAG TPA: outer membrane beta-barrel protein [Xanthobacteraceae bacterium]|nr:outer membrane beta-barrel protein [Xanthobacteraceae bacterium]
MGSSVRRLALVGAAVTLTLSAASAADLPPIIQGAPPPVVYDDFASGWYLRGDIGMSNQRVGSLFNALYLTPGVTVTNLAKSFDSAPIFGIGFGYQFNSWLRFDVTGEYRGKASFRGLDVYTPEPASGTGVGVDDYYGSKHEWVALANVYFDLGTWYGLSPFIGAGIGTAYNVISNFRDVNVATAGLAYAEAAGKWNFAWALHAGLAYHVTPGLIVELAYRYLDLGSARSGDLITYNGVSAIVNPMEFRDLTSHDVKVGVRWMIDTPPPPPPPLVTKG